MPSKWWHEQQHSVPFATYWDLQWSVQAALKAVAEVQESADRNTPSFDVKSSSTFQLVVASVNWISNMDSNEMCDACGSFAQEHQNLNTTRDAFQMRAYLDFNRFSQNHRTQLIFQLIDASILNKNEKCSAF